MPKTELVGDTTVRKSSIFHTKPISKFFFLSLLFVAQLINFILNFEILPSLSRKKTVHAITQDFSGNILITGDTLGKIDLVGCERFGSIARRVYFINKFNKYVFLDFGNITSDNSVANRALMRFFYQEYQPLNLAAVNLTKRDLINLDQCGLTDLYPTLISANLNIESSSIPEKMVRPYKYIPFTLRSQNESMTITIAVTGITNNQRKLHHLGLRFMVRDIKQSLDEIREPLEKVDMKILLYNDSWFVLKKLLIEDKIDFDLVIANSTLPSQVDKMDYINHTPVVFVEDQGRSIGLVNVIKTKSGFKFAFDAYSLGMGAKEDYRVKKQVAELIKYVNQEKGSHSHSAREENNEK